MAQGIRRCVSPASRADLVVDVRNMLLNGSHAQNELARDLCIALAARKQSKDLYLTLR